MRSFSVFAAIAFRSVSVSPPLPGLRLALAWLTLGLAGCLGGWAQAAVLQLEGPGGSRQIDTETLLRHPAAREIDVPADVAYHRPMRYRAVPLAVVLNGLGLTASETLEAVALDGFVAQLPGALVLRQGPDQPWLAVEPAGAPWPALPGKAAGAGPGPFYIVWPVAEGVRSEQWPYAVARLQVRQAPDQRWPQIAVAPEVPAADARRRGQAVFVAQCFVCHTMNGGGEARLGPDLNLPMSPVEYFQPQALRQLVRNPASVRQWPGQSMPAFTPGMLSERDLDDLVAYLQHMARDRRAVR